MADRQEPIWHRPIDEEQHYQITRAIRAKVNNPLEEISATHGDVSWSGMRYEKLVSSYCEVRRNLESIMERIVNNYHPNYIPFPYHRLVVMFRAMTGDTSFSEGREASVDWMLLELHLMMCWDLDEFGEELDIRKDHNIRLSRLEDAFLSDDPEMAVRECLSGKQPKEHGDAKRMSRHERNALMHQIEAATRITPAEVRALNKDFQQQIWDKDSERRAVEAEVANRSYAAPFPAGRLANIVETYLRKTRVVDRMWVDAQLKHIGELLGECRSIQQEYMKWWDRCDKEGCGEREAVLALLGRVPNWAQEGHERFMSGNR